MNVHQLRRCRFQRKTTSQSKSPPDVPEIPNPGPCTSRRRSVSARLASGTCLRYRDHRPARKMPTLVSLTTRARGIGMASLRASISRRSASPKHAQATSRYELQHATMEAVHTLHIKRAGQTPPLPWLPCRPRPGPASMPGGRPRALLQP